MDTELRIKASKLFKTVISEGNIAGLDKIESISRARDIVLEYTGIDLSDAISEKYTPPNVEENEIHMFEYCCFFIEGIKNCIKNNKRPTLKPVLDRKKKLKKLDKYQVGLIINKLIEENKIYLDNSKIKTAYYPVEKDSSND